MRFLIRSITAAVAIGLCLSAQASDLLQTYQQAQDNDMTFKAAKETYNAAAMGTNIAFGELLPQISATADTTFNDVHPATINRYNTNEFTLTLNQTLFNMGAWYAYKVQQKTVKQAALTYAQAQQNLIQNVAKAYFQVLEDQDKLRYAIKNEESLKQQMTQTDEQYKVGLKAYTDVQSIRASYEAAIASRVSAANDVHNDLQALAAITGHQEKDLAPLKSQFPLITPEPANPENWVAFGMKHNLQLLFDQMQPEIDAETVKQIKGGGNGTVTGYWPTASFQGTLKGSKDNSTSNGRVKTSTAQLNATWNIFNGFTTYHTVQQTEYTKQADQYTAQQTARTTAANIRQAYRNIVSDISQVKALRQAVISGESSLQATRAAYEVGTRTIVDLLTEQSNLFDSQQQYADAIFKYITDSLELKFQAGILTANDIRGINKWLVKKIATANSK